MNDNLDVWEMLALAQQAASLGDQHRASQLAHQVIPRFDALRAEVTPTLKRGQPLPEWVARIDDLPSRPAKRRPPSPAADVDAAVHVAASIAKKDITVAAGSYVPPWTAAEVTPPRVQLLITSSPNGININGYVPDSRTVSDEIYQQLITWFVDHAAAMRDAQLDWPPPTDQRWSLELGDFEALIFPEPGWEDQARHHLAFTVTSPGVMARALVVRRPLLRLNARVLGATPALADQFTERFADWLQRVFA